MSKEGQFLHFLRPTLHFFFSRTFLYESPSFQACCCPPNLKILEFFLTLSSSLFSFSSPFPSLNNPFIHSSICHNMASVSIILLKGFLHDVLYSVLTSLPTPLILQSSVTHSSADITPSHKKSFPLAGDTALRFCLSHSATSFLGFLIQSVFLCHMDRCPVPCTHRLDNSFRLLCPLLIVFLCLCSFSVHGVSMCQTLLSLTFLFPF